MNKFKIDVKRNSLSWEKQIPRICDNNDCKEKGEYRAPKSRIKLNEYYFFCLKHVKEYNKSWDFYKGLTVNQIEKSMLKDIVWDRPSWPFKGSPKRIIEQIDKLVDENYNILNEDNNNRDFYKNKLLDQTITSDQNKALNNLDLKLPVTLEEIKKKYKKLVKIFHPDVNGNDKNAEDKFKMINESYKILIKKFMK